LAQTVDPRKRKPVEERCSIFTPGIEKEGPAGMGTGKSTDCLRERGIGALPVCIGHSDGPARGMHFV
jgi:hypothetical protein